MCSPVQWGLWVCSWACPWWFIFSLLCVFFDSLITTVLLLSSLNWLIFIRWKLFPLPKGSFAPSFGPFLFAPVRLAENFFFYKIMVITRISIHAATLVQSIHHHHHHPVGWGHVYLTITSMYINSHWPNSRYIANGQEAVCTVWAYSFLRW